MLDVRNLNKEESTPAVMTAQGLESLIVQGDLGALTAQDRVAFYRLRCDAAGLDPILRPFDYLQLSGKLVLYLNKGGADQLRKVHGISITKLERHYADGLVEVTAYGMDQHGRSDSSLGVVSTAGLRGEALANAAMKAETKAKRRLTLSMAGLGMLDDSEVDTVPDAHRLNVDPESGEIRNTEVVEVPSKAPPFVPLRDRAPEQDETIRNADDPLWQRWLVVQGEASGLGIAVPRVGLPMLRSQLAELGRGMRDAIEARKTLLREQERAAKEPMATSRNAPEVRALDEVLAALAAVDHDDPKLHVTSFPTPLALVNANLAAARAAYAELEAEMEAANAEDGRF